MDLFNIRNCRKGSLSRFCFLLNFLRIYLSSVSRKELGVRSEELGVSSSHLKKGSAVSPLTASFDCASSRRKAMADMQDDKVLNPKSYFLFPRLISAPLRRRLQVIASATTCAILFFLIFSSTLSAVTVTERQWDDDAGDDDFWTASNWSGNNRPNGTNEGARFTSTLGSNYTITVSQDVTLETLRFNSPNNVTLNNGGAGVEITMDSNEDTPEIVFLANTGNVDINEDVYFVDNLLISNSKTSGTADFNGTLSNLTGKTLTFDAAPANTVDTKFEGDVTITDAQVYVNDGSVRVTGAGVDFLLDGGGNSDFYVGNSANDIASFEIVNDADLDIDSELYIASNASAVGDMNVGSGADVTVDNTSRIGQRGTGELNVTGSGSSFTQEGNNFDIGVDNNSHGYVRIANGGTLTSTNTNSTLRLGVNSGSIGSIRILGDGTRVNLDAVRVGVSSAETNDFYVADSAIVTAADNFTIGDNTGSYGRLRLRTNASLTVTGNVNVGDVGTGVVDLTGSGTVLDTEEKIYVGKNTIGIGTVTLTTGARIISDSVIVQNSGSVLTGVKAEVGISNNSEDDKIGMRDFLKVRSDGVVTLSDTFRVGQAATETGVASILSGGDITVGGNAYVADQGTGTMVVSGSGSTGTFSSTLYVGNDSSSYGIMTIDSGADVNVSGQTYLGGTGTGTIILTGSGSEMHWLSGSTNVIANGNGGKGLLEVRDGALFTHTQTSSNNLYIGNHSASTGSILVTGAGTTALLEQVFIGLNDSKNSAVVVSNTATLAAASGFAIGHNTADSEGSLTIQSGADVTANGTTLIGNNGTGTAVVTGTGSTFTGTTVTVASSAGSVGNLTVASGGSFDVSSFSYIGDAGTGNLEVSGNGSTYIGGDDIHVGKSNGGVGQLTLSSSATLTGSDRLYVGTDAGSLGTISITDGADAVITGWSYIGNSGTGTMVVSGTGSTFTGIDDVHVGAWNGSDGKLVLSNSATLTSSDRFYVGTNTGALGVTTIMSGADAVVNGWTYVGNSGTGSMVVTGSGSTYTGGDDVHVGGWNGSDGTLVLSNSATLTASDEFHIGANAGAKGTTTIESGATATTTNNTYIGNASTGTLVVTGTNSRYTGSDVIVADDAGSEGNLTVASGGSLHATNLTVKRQTSTVSVTNYNIGTTTPAADYITVEDTFTLSDTAQLTQNGGNFYIGNASGESGAMVVQSDSDFTRNADLTVGISGTGALTVTGSGSSYTNTNNLIVVGDNSGSNGVLTIANGATLTNTGTSAFLYVGNDSGSIGSVVVTGAGTTAQFYTGFIGSSSKNDNVMNISNSATVTVANGMNIGQVGEGTINITDGGNYDASSHLLVGGFGTGTLNLTGSNSTLNVDATLDIGNNTNAKGVFQMSGGALLTNTAAAASFQVGDVASSVGTAEISGAGTTALIRVGMVGVSSTNDNVLKISNSAVLDASSSFTIAENANSNGSMTIESGADVTVTGDTNIGSNGTGSMAITGSNSSLTVSSSGVIYVGENSGSNGLLTMSSGALLTRTGGAGVALLVGKHASSVGSVLISGDGTTALLANVRVAESSTQANYLEVSNSAVLTSDGGFNAAYNSNTNATVLVQSGSDVTVGANFRSGRSGTGSVTVTGSNTTMSVGGDAQVGQNNGSNGLLSISSGAVFSNTATSSDFTVGVNASSVGSVSVSGAGTTALLYDVVVGDASTNANEMVVSNTAVVDIANDLVIADDANSNGAMTVQSGGGVTVDGVATIGDVGTGLLTVNGSGSTFTTNANANLNIATATVSAGGTWQANASVTAGNLSGKSELTVTGSGSTMNVAANLGVGNASTATLTVSSGAVLTATSSANFLVLGSQAGSLGTALITDAGTTALLNDLYVGQNSANDNQLIVSDSAVVDVARTLYVGNNASTAQGTVTIKDGGDMTVDGTSYIGNAGSGTVVVTGTNSKFTGGDVIVADDAGSEGNLTVASAGRLHATNLTVKRQTSSVSVTNYNIGGETPTADYITVADTFTLSDTASLTHNAGNFLIGNASGESGTFQITSDADFTRNADLTIGISGEGSMIVTGSGSTYTNASDDIIVGDNSGSSGYLSVASGALLTNTGTNSDLRIGLDAGAIGSVSISGAGTTALLDEAYIGVASSEANALLISNTANVVMSNFFVIAEDTNSVGAITIASGGDLTVDVANVGDEGTATMMITGSGSSMKVTNNLSVGTRNGGNAILTVADGALLDNDGLTTRLGYFAGAIGSLNITGNGTTALLGDTYVGHASAEDNQVKISNSATVNVSTLTLGNGTGNRGTVTIESGGVLNMTGAGTTAFVGNQGTGSLTLTGSGSKIDLNTTGMYVGHQSGSKGVLTVSSGAVLEDGFLFVGDDSGSIGSVSITGAGTTASLSTFVVGVVSGEDNNAVISNTAQLSFTTFTVGNSANSNGSVTISDGADVDANGTTSVGFQGTGNLTVTGTGTTYDASDQDIIVSYLSTSQATMELSSGAVLTNTGTNSDFFIGWSATAAADGTFTVTGAGTTALLNNLAVNRGSTAENNMNVSNTAVVTVAGTFDVGDLANTNGVVTIASGADMTVAGDSRIGDAGTGSVIVAGTGSTFTANGDIYVGDDAGSVGAVTVNSGANITATNDNITIGATGDGRMVVTGSGSSFNITPVSTATLALANQDGSKGYFELSAGAQMTATATDVIMRVGASSNSGIGSAVITGAGTTAKMYRLVTGYQSEADNVTVISNSAVVTTVEAFRIGRLANGNGTVTIASGADVTVGTTVEVANYGTGTMILNGSGSTLMVTNNVYIARQDGAVGELTIESGATMDVGGSIFVGNTNTGTATLNLKTNNGIIGNSDMVLGGGTFNPEGVTQAVGGLQNLTMTENSIIDMDGGNSIINWALIDENNWDGTLIIHNWDGTRNQVGGNDQLIFDDIAGFNLATTQVYFYSGAGTGDLGFGRFKETSLGSGYWELIPAPEPSTWCGIGLLISFAFWRERKRIYKLLQSFNKPRIHTN